MIIIVPLESPSLSDTLPGELELADDVGDVLVERVGDVVLVELAANVVLVERVGDVVLVELNLTSEVVDLIVGEFGLVIPLGTDVVSGFVTRVGSGGF
jgi:hypothetical protein